MAKQKNVYICNQCGGVSPKWSGQCPFCGEWNTLEESVSSPVTEKSVPAVSLSATAINDISTDIEDRIDVGINEFNRVLGGGLVKGSVVLLSGDPGIGKSTILLQACNNVRSGKVLYVTGEESARQIKLRAQRLGVDNPFLYVLSETDIISICEHIKSEKPSMVIIDSIQTMNHGALNSSPGSITQVRECSSLLLRYAKDLNIPIIIVGHINKGGDIAGPKVMEHIVDTVLYFEGEKTNTYRILRANKNRFGSTNEIGVFDMQNEGLCEVENPSALMLSGRLTGVPGSAVCSIVEGSRPIFVEVQGLTATSTFGNARRTSSGFDYNRLNLILAVLEKRAGMFFTSLDVYINVVGGLKLYEPAGDLAVAAALISALREKPTSSEMCCFGEIGLSGEVRTVPHALIRVKEAERMGFTTCILPKGCYKQLVNFKSKNIDLKFIHTVQELSELI